MPMLDVWSIKEIAIAVTTDTDAYSAGDCVGGLLTLTNAKKNIQNEISGGYISDIFLVDSANKAASINVWLFAAAPTAIADDAAFQPPAADLVKCMGFENIATYETNNSINFGHADNLTLEFPRNGDANLYAMLECTATPNWATAVALTLKFHILTY